MGARPEWRDLAAAAPDLSRGEMTGRAGFATFGSRVRLRDDSPSLTHVIEAERAAALSLRRSEGFDSEREGLAGPEGSCGSCDRTTPAFAPSIFVGPYFGPVGEIPLGLRPPSGSDVPAPIFTASSSATSDSDSWSHRPGLSTGSGIYGRSDSR